MVIPRYLRNAVFLFSGVFCAGVGLKGFLLPNQFLDGGVVGISLLANILSGLSLPLLLVVINAPFIFMGYRQISLGFAVKAILSILLLALFIKFAQIPVFTNDKLLIAIFGGVFLGAGIGLSIRGGSVIDGTEVLAIFVSRRTGLTVGDVITLINIFIFITAILLIDVETALYSILTYFSASRMADFVITGIEEYIGVTIVSEKSEDVRIMITETMGRGVTIYKGGSGYGKRGFKEQDKQILFCVVTRLEVQRLVHEVEKIDEQAFVIQHSINDTKGGMIKKRPLH